MLLAPTINTLPRIGHAKALKHAINMAIDKKVVFLITKIIL